MKRINGTITLSFVEEDNKQRVIFRIVPLCTREGVTFRDSMETFPDQGSLRVVPDKREQSTFKERMREMGKLCAVELISTDGKELGKVRQNRNYDPAQGECNQYAIYSDVVFEFAAEGAFEVISWEPSATLTEAPLTQSVLFLSEKVLYGPVAKDDLEAVDIKELKPFGNDQFLLHTVVLPDGTSHCVYWNPEATINWRQRRGSLRRKIDKSQHGDAEMPSVLEAQAADLTQEEERFLRGIADADSAPVNTEESPAMKPIASIEFLEQQAEPKAIPIGIKLEILDSALPFEQQISRLDQPLSESANRLSVESIQKSIQEQGAPVRYTGTPFVRDSVHMPKATSRPEPLHHVVEQQMRMSREERMGGEWQGGAYRQVENPIENLLMAVDAAWENQDTREQAVAALMDNPGFVDRIVEALRGKGQQVHAVAAAYAQLEDIEAERLSLLLQLEQAKENRKAYQEQVAASLSQRKQEEIARLEQSVEALSSQKEQLQTILDELSKQSMDRVLSALADRVSFLGGMSADGNILVCSVVGKQRSAQELRDSLYARLSASGFAITQEDALIFLITFALFPSLCICAQKAEDAQFFASVLLEALGLQNVCAMVRPNSVLQISSLLLENECRTPTVTVQALGTEQLSMHGHKTLYWAAEGDIAQRGASVNGLFPVVRVPSLNAHKGSSLEALPLVSPTSLASFTDMAAEVHPLSEEGEEWFGELCRAFETAGTAIPDAVLLGMRRFVAVASRKLRGGFLAAADAAMCQWMIPRIHYYQLDVAVAQAAVSSLPHTLEALGIQ